MHSAKYTKREYISPEEAFMTALDTLRGKVYSTEQICVWRIRYKRGTLSHKKVQSVLEEAGFKRVVEEKWMLVRRGEEAPPTEISIDSGDGGDFSGIDFNDLPEAI